jgi:NitT/TauT family transport system ATP-binding protein
MDTNLTSVAHLSVNQITQTFEGAGLVLGPVSFSAKPGERIALVGPSGCGKSTMLRLIADLDRPASGQIDIAQPSDQDAPDKERNADIGFVFQDAALLPWANVIDNVWLPLRLKGMSRNDAKGRISELLDRVGLVGWGEAKPAQLSGGMKMRVSIARSLIERPSLLLMDEPFAALDELTRFDLNDMLSDLIEQTGITLVFVTHTVLEAVYLADRIIVLSAHPGQIVADLPIDLPHPRNADLRATPAFLARCATVSGALRAAATAKVEPA